MGTDDQHDMLQQVIEFLREKGGVAGNGKIVSNLRLWQSKQQFLDWRRPYLESKVLVKRRGKGGATALATKSKPQSPTNEISEQAKRLLDLIPQEAPIGNTRLQSKFGISGIEYWRVRDELLRKGYIKTGKGRGGSVSRTQPVGLSYEIQKSFVEDEKEFYEPLRSWLKDEWAKDAEDQGDYYRVKVTASASGRRRDSGQWSRPDVTFVRVNKFDLLPSASVEVTSFEVKPYRTSHDLASVYEAAAHARSAHYTYLVNETSKEKKELDENVVKECNRLGVGIIIAFKDGKGYGFEDYSEPKRNEPTPEEVDDSLKSFFSDDNRELRKFRSAIGK